MNASPIPDPMRAAFVGSGFMAEVHSRAVRAGGGRLARIASSSPDSSARAAAHLGFEESASSLPEALASGVDVVHIVTPNATHKGIALAAIASGRAIICEKPIATSLTDAVEMESAASDAGVVTAVPFVYRYHPMVREARDRIARGESGRILTIQASYLQDWLASPADDNWRVDGRLGGPSRAFADIGSHLCDLIEFVTGDRITRLSALTRTFFTERATQRTVTTEDAVALVAEMDAGALVTVLVSQAAPGRKNRLAFEIAGSGESIGFDQEQPESLWLGRRDGSQLILRDGAALSPEAARLSILPPGHPLGYQDAFNAFVADAYATIRGEARDGLPTFADGVRAAQLTEAVLRSAETGDWVDTSELVRSAS